MDGCGLDISPPTPKVISEITHPLAEAQYRFNRRFDLSAILVRLVRRRYLRKRCRGRRDSSARPIVRQPARRFRLGRRVGIPRNVRCCVNLAGRHAIASPQDVSVRRRAQSQMRPRGLFGARARDLPTNLKVTATNSERSLQGISKLHITHIVRGTKDHPQRPTTHP